uniref:LicD motif-containing protein n=1 Tax=Philodina roseola TaxID=96448 RepID=B2L3I7_PHIRO|nr:LicD motif-containing protein [Philodina roseola]
MTLVFIPFVPLRRNLFIFASTILFGFPLTSLLFHQQSVQPYTDKTWIMSNVTSYRQFCQQIDQRIEREIPVERTVRLQSGYKSIPYAYSEWRSTSLMPRALTTCEHAIYMQLLSILVKHVFKKYNIPYMMMAATLLGSYTRHDILPWDDDVDLRVGISDRQRFQSIIRNELSSPPYSIVLMQMYNERNYDKIFFSWSPFAGETPWRFPFIDIFYHDQNDTHVWLLGTPSSCPERREDVFPLVFRPLGSLWLLAPREPMAHFEARKMVHIETGCYIFPYSHKYERLLRKDVLNANCNALRYVYPYVERQCSSKHCIETLKLNGEKPIHQVNFQYVYRAQLNISTYSLKHC